MARTSRRWPAAALAAVLALGASQVRAGVQPDTPGIITTVAGGVGGPGPATGVPLAVYGVDPSPYYSSGPCGVSYGGALYVSDGVVRQVNASTGRLTTAAGTFASAPPGAGGPAAAAALESCGTVKDSHGNLIVTDGLNNLVRVVAGSAGTFYGQAMTKGGIYTIAGGGNQFPDGQPAIQAGLYSPYDVTVDPEGDVIFVDEGLEDIRGAELVMIAGTSRFFDRQNMTAGDIYRLAGAPTSAGGFASGDDGPSVRAYLGYQAGGVHVDAAGNVVLADTGGNEVRVVAARTGTFYGVAMTRGDIYPVAGTGSGGFSGDGGPALAAELSGPGGLAFDGAGNLVIADTLNRRVRVVAERTGTFYGQAMTAGDIYTVAGDGNAGFSGDGGPATAASLGFPVRVAVDGSGSLVIADQSNQRVRVVAERTGTFYGQAMTAGDIYTVAGLSSPTGTPGFSGDGGPAASAELDDPQGVAVDPAGNLLVTDMRNNRIRQVGG